MADRIWLLPAVLVLGLFFSVAFYSVQLGHLWLAGNDPSEMRNSVYPGPSKRRLFEDQACKLKLAGDLVFERALLLVSEGRSHTTQRPIIYVITPTYKRFTQKADLTRFAQTLLLVQDLHWILVEDTKNKTALVTRLLRNSGLSYTHLNVATPKNYISKVKSWTLHPRGTTQRNLGISWLREHLTLTDKGVVYFADDDNTYDRRLFEEMRYTEGVSCWPAGLHGAIIHGGPICKNGKVIGFRAEYKPDRPFAMDMCSFAVNTRLLVGNPDAQFDIRAQPGYQESSLLTKITTVRQLEPKASNCTKILVWHTRTERPLMYLEEKLKKRQQMEYNRVLPTLEV